MGCYARCVNDSLLKGLQWYSSRHADNEAHVCPARDIFQARLDSMYRAMLVAGKNANETSLLTAAVGEIGNNCFDHNLGKWGDVAGCWFHYTHEGSISWVVTADRGQGILASLQQVEPALDSHQAALETAFHKQISGRAPEQRGNGLKFVRSVINGHSTRGLCCTSGNGMIAFGGLSRLPGQALSANTAYGAGHGTFVIIGWDLQ